MKTTITLLLALFSFATVAQTYSCLDQSGEVISVNGHNDYLCASSFQQESQEISQKVRESSVEEECLDAQGNLLTGINGHNDWQCEKEWVKAVKLGNVEGYIESLKNPSAEPSRKEECIDSKGNVIKVVNGHTDWQCV